jgi:hypothetical protein
VIRALVPFGTRERVKSLNLVAERPPDVTEHDLGAVFGPETRALRELLQSRYGAAAPRMPEWVASAG